MRSWTAFGLLLGLPTLAVPGRGFGDVSSRILQASVAGIDHIYEMDFQAADREFRRIILEDPEHPFSYYGMAGAAWVRYTYGTQRNDPRLAEELERQASEAVRRSQLWVRRHPKDAWGLLALGGSYGLKSRHGVMTGRWLQAVVDGRKAVKYTRLAHRRDPELHDALLGIGMWEYYADVFPRLIKALGKLLLGGDRLAGIRHLEAAAEKGRLVKVTAQLILIEIFLHDGFGLRDPSRSLAMIRRLRRRFPNSPIFHQIEQVAAYESGDLEGAWRLTDQYMQRIGAKAPFYNEEETPRMHVVYGTIDWSRRRLDAAHESFSRAAAGIGPRDKPNRWALWGLIRLGEVEDALGRRDDALKSYREALSYPDLFGFHERARVRLKKPFKDGGPIGMVAPP